MKRIIAKHEFFVCALVLTLGLLPLYGCGGGGTEEFSCNFTRSISSGSMRMSVTYDCSDQVSCSACTGDGDCSGCREVNREDIETESDDNIPTTGPMTGSDDDAECRVGLELMPGETCSFDDGRNRFTLTNTGSRCCLGSICAGGTLAVSNVVVIRNAEGDCVIDDLP